MLVCGVLELTSRTCYLVAKHVENAILVGCFVDQCDQFINTTCRMQRIQADNDIFEMIVIKSGLSGLLDIQQ